MDEQIENRLKYIHWATYLYNTSLTELQIISNEVFTTAENKIVSSHTFDFYRVTLQYCFIMEYCKLLEYGSKNNKEHISSINRLNDICMEDKKKNFEKLYKENNQLFEKIKSSDFYGKMKLLRDKKFGHADNNKINTPFKVEGFRTEDFVTAFEHLQIIKTIFNNFGSIYGRQYDLEIPSRDDRTRNFIKFHSEYQTYYMENFLSVRKNRK